MSAVYVFYTDPITHGGDSSLRTFIDDDKGTAVEKAEKFIEEHMANSKEEADISKYTVIKGIQVPIHAVQVVTKVAIDS